MAIVGILCLAAFVLSIMMVIPLLLIKARARVVLGNLVVGGVALFPLTVGIL